jgi:hypothetical protein
MPNGDTMGLELAQVALERVAVLARPRQQRRLLRAGVRVARLTVDELALDGRDLVDLVLDRGGDELRALLELVQALGRGDGVGLGTAHDPDDAGVLVGDALHELRALEQVGEAVGLQHDRHRVGLVGLVELDQPLGERGARLGEAGAQAGQAQPLAAQVLLDAGQFRALAIEVRLQADLAGLQHGDLALQPVDPAREARHVRGQHALATLARGDLVALLVDLAVEVLGSAARSEREQGEEDERERRHADEQAKSQEHAAAMLGAPLVPGHEMAAPYGACKESCSVQGFLAHARRGRTRAGAR